MNESITWIYNIIGYMVITQRNQLHSEIKDIL